MIEERDSAVQDADLPPGVFWCALGIIVALLAGYFHLVWGSFAGFNAALGHCTEPLCDFVEHYWPMGKRVLRGKGPVQGFFYPPFFALALRPFGILSLETATLCWGALQVLLVAVLWWSPRMLWRQPFDRSYLLYTAVLGSSYPVLLNFKWGQVSVLLAVLVLGAFAARRVWLAGGARGRHGLLAALLLALAISIKVYPVVFLLPFVFARDWRVLGTVVVFATVLLALLPFAALGVEETWNFYEALSRRLDRVSENTGPSSQYFRNVLDHWTASLAAPKVWESHFPPALHGLRTFLAPHADWVRMLLLGAGYVALAINVLLGFLLWRRRPERELAWWFLLVSCSLPFLTPTSWPHYFVFLPLGQLLVWRELRARAGAGRVVASLLLLASVALASIFAFNVVGSWQVFNYYGATAFANLALLLATYAVLARVLGAREESA